MDFVVVWDPAMRLYVVESRVRVRTKTDEELLDSHGDNKLFPTRNWS